MAFSDETAVEARNKEILRVINDNRKLSKSEGKVTKSNRVVFSTLHDSLAMSTSKKFDAGKVLRDLVVQLKFKGIETPYEVFKCVPYNKKSRKPRRKTLQRIKGSI